MTLRGRKVRLDHAVRVAAYCDTMRDFQKLVVKRVMTAALADSVQHKREKVREKIKEKAGDAAARLNETRAAMRKKIFGVSSHGFCALDAKIADFAAHAACLTCKRSITTNGCNP